LQMDNQDCSTHCSGFVLYWHKQAQQGIACHFLSPCLSGQLYCYSYWEGAGKVQGRCKEGAGKVQGRCRELRRMLPVTALLQNRPCYVKRGFRW
jgi:hypothetical protein